MRRAFNPYRVHRVRFESPLGVVEAARALAATDKTRLGRGLHACQLRVQVDGANVLIDPLSANVSFTSGQERLFRGTLQPNSDGVGTVLVGGFSLFWMARLIFFPVSLFGGAGVAAAAICHSSLLLGLMAALFLYWASTYVFRG